MKTFTNRVFWAFRIPLFFLTCIILSVGAKAEDPHRTESESDRALFEKKLEYARSHAARENDELFSDSIRTGDSGLRRSESIGLGTLILRIAGYLSLVAVLIVGIAWFLRKNGSRAGTVMGGATDIIETLPIGQGRHVTLVRIQDTILVVGHTPHNVALLDRIEGQKAVELIATGKGGTSIEQFKDVFSSFVGKMKKSS